MQSIFVALLLVAALPSNSHAESLDDCMLRSLKNVSSDAAAQMVARACQNKAREDQKKLRDSYGDQLDSTSIELDITPTGIRSAEAGYIEQRITNKSETSVVTYVVLRIRDDPSCFESAINQKPAARKGRNGSSTIYDKYLTTALCTSLSNTFHYQMQLLPKQSSFLKFKISGKQFYSDASLLLGRKKKLLDTLSSNSDIILPISNPQISAP